MAQQYQYTVSLKYRKTYDHQDFEEKCDFSEKGPDYWAKNLKYCFTAGPGIGPTGPMTQRDNITISFGSTSPVKIIRVPTIVNAMYFWPSSTIAFEKPFFSIDKSRYKQLILRCT